MELSLQKPGAHADPGLLPVLQRSVAAVAHRVLYPDPHGDRPNCQRRRRSGPPIQPQNFIRQGRTRRRHRPKLLQTPKRAQPT